LLYSAISNNKYKNERKQTMAKNGNPNDGHREGAVRQRSQTFNPKTKHWVKRDTEMGRFIDQKADNEPFKGVRKEKKLVFNNFNN
jgi:hypothetical protein